MQRALPSLPKHESGAFCAKRVFRGCSARARTAGHIRVSDARCYVSHNAEVRIVLTLPDGAFEWFQAIQPVRIQALGIFPTSLDEKNGTDKWPRNHDWIFAPAIQWAQRDGNECLLARKNSKRNRPEDGRREESCSSLSKPQCSRFRSTQSTQWMAGIESIPLGHISGLESTPMKLVRPALLSSSSSSSMAH